MDKAEVNIDAKPSGWYYADLTVAIVTVLGLCLTWVSMVYQTVAYIPFIALIAGIIVYSRKEYYADKLSKPWRIVTGIIRGALYAIALFSLSVPFIMSADVPFIYPVQKAVYLKNYTDPESIFGFLPDTIPSNAENYKVRFVPKVLQGEAYIQIEFFTDRLQLEKYRAYAQSCGAVKTEANKGWQEYLNEKTGTAEGAEAWEFPASTGGGCRAAYYICPESGFFMITW